MQSWYVGAVAEFRHECTPRYRSVSRFQLEAFVRVVVAMLFERSTRTDFPETFYLDKDRLRTLKAELNDSVCFEICTETCDFLAKEFGYQGSPTPTGQHQLHTSIQAIMGEAIGHGAHQWSRNSEAISLEILRHASRLAGRAPTAHFDRWAEVNQHVQTLFTQRSTPNSTRLETLLLPLILSHVERSTALSPIQLYNNILPPTASSLPCTPKPTSQWHTSTTLTPSHTTHPYRLTELATRIAHIISLHWRTWASIAYVQDDTDNNNDKIDSNEIPTTFSSIEIELSPSSPPCRHHPQPQSQSQHQPPPLSPTPTPTTTTTSTTTAEDNVSVAAPTPSRPLESHDACQETHISRQTSSSQ